MRSRWLPGALTALAVATPAAAAPVCRAVEIQFGPGAPDLQIVAWIEDAQGKFIDTAYITRLTGTFGLANRPGSALLKTDFRWPFGRREMVAPVWAHRRDKRYPKVVMGGACGNAITAMCPGGGQCGSECDDTTIAYHSRVSSYEPFYCSPSGASKIDALSCASKGTFPKGAYADPPAFSLYPPRADLNAFNPTVDSPDLNDFAKRNDLVAISRATPAVVPGKALDPPLTWFPPNGLPDGEYVAWIELSQESDFNAQHRHPNAADTVQAWDFEGHPFLGQPSVVYKVPFRITPDGYSAITNQYAGYGAWDGQSGTLFPRDGTITEGVPGTGAGRLLEVRDAIDSYRVKVVVGACAKPDPPDGGEKPMDGGMPPPPPMCEAPDPVTDLVLAPTATSMQVTFRSPTGGAMANRYAVRYREGDAPITDENFDRANAAPDPPTPAAPGDPVTTTISGLLAQTAYTVAVRGVSPCNKPSPVVSSTRATPLQQFAVLHGCFVATAAFGSPMAAAVERLRAFRDRALLGNPAGQLFVAAYYAVSPSLAGAIAGDRRLRAAARAALAPLVSLAGAGAP